MRKLFVVFLLLLFPAAAVATPRPFLDLDFEAPECSSGWFSETLSAYDHAIDGAVAQSGTQSLRLRYLSSGAWTPQRGYGSVLQTLPPAEVAGKRVRLSGFIRTEGVTAGYASLWWISLNRDGSFSYAESNPVAGTRAWTPDALELDIPADARRILFGVQLAGDGQAWFDNLKVEVGGEPWHDGPSPHLQIPSPGDVHWLQSHAIPFQTTDPGSGFADLQALKPVIGNARIVSLGEQTHGTSEFFRMKHRMLEFLATEMGFTHFGIEANLPEAQKINEYVLTGQGDPRALLSNLLLWPWQAQEVLDMILWMRDFNASGKGPLQFTGFDAQFTGIAPANVRAFLAQADPDYVPVADGAFARIVTAEARRRMTAAEVAVAQSVYDYLLSQRDRYLASFSRSEVDTAIQNARVVLQTAGYLSGLVTRDQSMADNVDWILGQAPAGSKIVLWAHNGHVRKDPAWMGGLLAQRHGADMLVLGFAFAEGSYNTIGFRGLTSYPAAAAPTGSVETFLASAGIPRYFLDLRGAHPPASWLQKPQNFRSGEAIFQRCPFFPTVITDDYDVLIWINTSTPSALLPF